MILESKQKGNADLTAFPFFIVEHTVTLREDAVLQCSIFNFQEN